MNIQLSSKSRKEKELVLKEIIQKLNISQTEKQIYSICIEVLDDSGLDDFFEKIMYQFNSKETQAYTSIEPFTATLI